MHSMLKVPPVHTYSIVARDPQTGEMGVAVQSHYFSVGSIVTWAEAGVGAVATQAFARMDYGPEGVALMREGRTAEEALGALLAQDELREARQVAMVDARGNTAVHTGARCIEGAGHAVGDQFTVQANMMVDDTVWPAMKDAYEGAEGDLADRLVAALVAAQEAGGDIRGQQSAALLVVSGTKGEKPWYDRLFDLRVEDHPQPLDELKRLVLLRRAYRLQDMADDLMTHGEFAEAATMLEQAFNLAPDVMEIKFWAGISLCNMGREGEGLDILREVFSREPVWADLVPRLVKPGLLKVDPAIIERI